MKITPLIAKYKNTVDSLTADELLTVLNNSRLNDEERFAVELKDVCQKTTKQAADIMNLEERQFARYLRSGREKIIKRFFK